MLADALAATNATANLLGRARIRERYLQAMRKHEPEKLAEVPPHVELFDEPEARELKPLPPEKAVAYFKRLVPTVGVKDPPRFGQLMRREAFTLAATVDVQVLDQVKQVIQGRLETGQAVRAAPAEIDEILGRAGVSPANPQYAEMVTRTNMMDAYNQGVQEEIRDPDVADVFPVWRYLGIRDGRQRARHEKHFNQYFPNSSLFTEVRDSEAGTFDGFNCRCVPQPVDKWQWADLQKRGAAVSTFAERLVPDVRQEKSYDCGAGALAAALLSLGQVATVEDLAAEMDTNRTDGTRAGAIVEAARRRGIQAEPRWGMGLEDLRRMLDAGCVVICPVQMYGTQEQYDKAASGHWIVVYAMDSVRTLTFHDPARDENAGTRTVLIGEFLDRWHDRDTDGRYYYRFGVVLHPPANLGRFCMDGGPNHGMPGPCPGEGGSGDQPAPAPAQSPTPKPEEKSGRLSGIRQKVAEKVKSAAQTGAKKLAETIVNHQHIAPVIAAYQQAEEGKGAKVVAKAIVQEAGKKLGKTVVERVTGFSKDLWNEIASKHGKTAAVLASGAYIALNRASLVAETVSGIRLIPGLGSGVATARAYAAYYGVRAATNLIASSAGTLASAAKKVGKTLKSVAGFDESESGGELTVELLVALVRDYDRQLSEAAGVEPGQWSDEEILAAIDGLIPDAGTEV